MPGRWIGLHEANRALKKLPDFAKQSAQGVIDVTAYQISQGAQRRVRRRTGFLQARITWQSRPRSVSAVVGVEGEAFYWKFLEYGTVKMPPYPFIRPAAESLQNDHEARMFQALHQALTKMEREARG